MTATATKAVISVCWFISGSESMEKAEEGRGQAGERENLGGTGEHVFAQNLIVLFLRAY